MSDTVAAVVVTYNRKNLLIECLEALRNQTHKPDAIFIIDNISTDGTPEILFENKYILKLPQSDSNENQLIKNKISSLSDPNENIEINYVRKFENDGGSGGFHEGMKQAYKAGYNWLWLMDDDGIPAFDCLAKLMHYGEFGKIDYVAPNLIDEKGKSHFSEMFEASKTPIIPYYGGPFNGILLSMNLIKHIGLPITKFFIWGDEIEYRNRIMENGFLTVTVKNAKHHHKRTSYSLKAVPRVYFLSRNLIFCAKLFKGIYRSKLAYTLGIILSLLKIVSFAIIFLNFRQLKNCLKGINDGVKIDIKKDQLLAMNYFSKDCT
jgi:GT2 family glycosyltransferase